MRRRSTFSASNRFRRAVSNSIVWAWLAINPRNSLRVNSSSPDTGQGHHTKAPGHAFRSIDESEPE